MGLLKNGRWVDQWYDTKQSGGAFKRQDSRFRNWIEGTHPEAGSRFPAESGRYHLYLSLACPWAHRTLIFRSLKGLQAHIGVSLVDPLMLSNGWEFSTTNPDHLYGLNYLYQLYLKADPSYEGRVTVPVLWDRQEQTIVSNESSEIIRMLNQGFDQLTGNRLDLYPEALRPAIDAVNKRVYDSVNNGVYKAGFATEQKIYEAEVAELFENLDWLDEVLSTNRYLTGDRITEADWRLFTTLVRFDAVYVGHFKCNLKRIADYPNLSGYLRELYQITGVAETTNFDHIKQHYYASHAHLNPTGIVPVGPILNLSQAHGRGHLPNGGHLL